MQRLTPEEKERAVAFGKWLREQRKRRGMTQRQLSDKIETDSTRISEYENGRKVVSAEMAADFAKGLGVPQVVALIEAGYITDLSPELAALAAEVERLPEVERRAVIAAIAGMVSALGRRSG